MGMPISRGDVPDWMNTKLDVGEIEEMVTARVKTQVATAENMQESLSDPLLESAAVQANKTELKKPIKEVKAPKETTASESVYRKEQPKGLDKELDQHAQNFVERYGTMKKGSLLGIRKEVEDLGKEATPAQILATINKSYGKGHEAEAYHALDFLLETTTGDLQEVIKEAKDSFENANKPGIEKGLNIENLAKGVEGGVDEFKGKDGKIQNLNEKFIDLVAMEADTNLLDEHLLSKVSHEEAEKILKFFTSSAGDKMRQTEVGPEMHALWQSLQAIQGYRGVYNQINKANPAPHYERAIAKHIEQTSAAAA